MGDYIPSDKCIWLVCCLVLCVGGSVESTAVGVVCPDGLQLFESSCYLISEPQINGINSRSACANVHPGSHLAFIESQSEQTFLKQFIMASGSTDDYWFGLTFTTDADHPEWMDGRPLGDFTAWDEYGAFNEKTPCVRMRRDNDYLWSDRRCTGYNFGCICEIEIAEDETVFTSTPTTTDQSVLTTATAPSPQTKEAVYKAGPPNMAAPTGSHHLQGMSALSLFRCANYCLQNNNCASFNYKPADEGAQLGSFCELYSMQFPDEELTEKRGYRYYRV